MVNFKETHDVTSENEFAILERSASTDPQEDSPGDSEKNTREEFLVGMNYQPIKSELADGDEEIQNKNSTLERPNNLVFTPHEPNVPMSANS